MNEPVRLSAGGGSLTKELLRAGRAERPREKAKDDAATAALVVATTSACFLFTRKSAWLLFGVLGMVGAGLVTSTPAPSPRLATDELVTDVPVMVVRPRVPDSFVRDEGPAARARGAGAPSSPGSRRSEMAPTVPAVTVSAPAPSELELLRRARLELRADPQRALATLDEHADRFPRGELREEAAALRVEGLVRAGDAAAARAAAVRFGAAYPESAYGERVRSLGRKP